jgi:hypothetical protein
MCQRGDVLGPGIDHRRELGDVGEVPQCLHAARGGTGADRHQNPRLVAHSPDPFHIGRGGDGPFDQRDVVRPGNHCGRCLNEVRDLHAVGHREQLILAVEQRELAPVTGGELPYGKGRAHHSSGTAINGSATS